MSYFNDFPIIYYSFGASEAPVLFQNLTTYIDLLDQIKDQNSFYSTYHVLDGDRPDTLSYKIYGDVQYYWTFFLMNEKLRVSGWPKTVQEIDNIIKKNYPHYTVTTKANISDSDFVPGNRVQGVASGTVGKIVEVNLELGQLVIDTRGYSIRRTGGPDADELPSFVLQQETDTNYWYIDLTELQTWQTDYEAISVGAVYTIDPLQYALANPPNLVAKFELRNNKLYLKSDTQPWTVPLYIDFYYRFYTHNNFFSTEDIQLIDVDTPRIAGVSLVSATKQYDSVHHYVNTAGEYVDINPFERNIQGLIPITQYERASLRNDSLKEIRIIKPDSINQVVSEFKKFLRNA